MTAKIKEPKLSKRPSKIINYAVMIAIIIYVAMLIIYAPIFISRNHHLMLVGILGVANIFLMSMLFLQEKIIYDYRDLTIKMAKLAIEQSEFMQKYSNKIKNLKEKIK